MLILAPKLDYLNMGIRVRYTSVWRRLPIVEHVVSSDFSASYRTIGFRIIRKNDKLD